MNLVTLPLVEEQLLFTKLIRNTIMQAHQDRLNVQLKAQPEQRSRKLITFDRFSSGAYAPSRDNMSPGCFALRSPENRRIAAKSDVTQGLQINLQLPDGMGALISQAPELVACSMGIMTRQIAAHDRNEIKVRVLNHTDEAKWIKRGQRLATLTFHEIPDVDLRSYRSLMEEDRIKSQKSKPTKRTRGRDVDARNRSTSRNSSRHSRKERSRSSTPPPAPRPIAIDSSNDAEKMTKAAIDAARAEVDVIQRTAARMPTAARRIYTPAALAQLKEKYGHTDLRQLLHHDALSRQDLKDKEDGECGSSDDDCISDAQESEPAPPHGDGLSDVDESGAQAYLNQHVQKLPVPAEGEWVMSQQSDEWVLKINRQPREKKNKGDTKSPPLSG